MKSAKIFLVEGKRKLTPMIETSYVTEDDLQALLADYPELIPGDQIDLENPRRWLLVAREVGVPGREDESGRWSLDHLFLDQDGTPTFVECKRWSDTRSRREVVAQMLDYAGVQKSDLPKRYTIRFSTLKEVGTTESNWLEFAKSGQNPVSYLMKVNI